MVKKQRPVPTLRQLIWSVITGLASHPNIISPEIFHPIQENEDGEPEEIFIEKWRTYDGAEIQEPGLTCSVYPKFANKSFTSPTPESRSVEITPYELNRGGLSKAVYYLIVQLHYQEVAINNPKTIDYYVIDSPAGMMTPHGLNFGVSRAVKSPRDLREFNAEVDQFLQDTAKKVTEKQIEVELNPGEEILRDYMDRIRAVLGEMGTILPWSIKSSQVTAMDFPTSSWQNQDENAAFHTAYLEWEVTLFIPGDKELKTMGTLPASKVISEP
jgi:hypothetical protein